MSSIESMVSEIDGEYNKLREKFKEVVIGDANYYYGYKEVSEEHLLDLLRNTLNFQRKIESSTISIIKHFSMMCDTTRLQQIEMILITNLSDSGVIFDKIDMPNIPNYQVSGVIAELKSAHNLLVKRDSRETDKYSQVGSRVNAAFYGFKLLYPYLIEFEEELRLISALTTYPIEKKTLLKNKLVANDFQEVAISLEEAETNVESDHFRDCVSRCRDAVEILVATIREKETGEKTEKHFATDLAMTSKIGVFDEATQKLAQGVYSFLSVKGSHKYDSSKVTVYDAETSLQETYSLIELLLNKLSDYKKRHAKATSVPT